MSQYIPTICKKSEYPIEEKNTKCSPCEENKENIIEKTCDIEKCERCSSILHYSCDYMKRCSGCENDVPSETKCIKCNKSVVINKEIEVLLINGDKFKIKAIERESRYMHYTCYN